ncbi:TPA: hypothetical protein ACH3X1_002183 [Trebouxia sp. C0004]
MPDEDQPALGCSKCRHSQRGCKRCKDPAFNSRKRGNLTSCSKSRAPKRQSRHHDQPILIMSHGQVKQIGTKPEKTPETAMDTKQAAHHKLAVSTDQPQPLSLPQSQPKAPPPDSATTLANASAEWGAREPTATHNAGQPAHDCTDVVPERQAAVHTEDDAQASATKPRSICHADEEIMAAAAASPGVPYPEQDQTSYVAHTAAENQTLAADTDASQSMPALSPATGPTAGTAATAPSSIQQSQPALSAASGADVAAAAGPDQPVAIPPAASQPDPQVEPSSQATASDSRPSFLSMLQSKMDKQRQQRRESQSAGSASESSLSSVHAAGANSMGNSGPSVDSGTQAPQAMAAPRHKVKQHRRRSAKKPSKTRAFLQPGVDPRQALWHPPASPYGLIEEYLYQDPWKLLVACMLLNVTSGLQVRKVIWRLFDIWPTAEAAAGATDGTLVIVEKLIQPLGLFRKRTIAIKRFSQEYLEAEVRCVCMTYSIMDCGRPYDADSCCVAEGSTCNHSNVHPLGTLCI